MVLEGGVAGAQPLHKGGRLRPTAQMLREGYQLHSTDHCGRTHSLTDATGEVLQLGASVTRHLQNPEVWGCVVGRRELVPGRGRGDLRPPRGAPALGGGILPPFRCHFCVRRPMHPQRARIGEIVYNVRILSGMACRGSARQSLWSAALSWPELLHIQIPGSKAIASPTGNETELATLYADKILILLGTTTDGSRLRIGAPVSVESVPT